MTDPTAELHLPRAVALVAGVGLLYGANRVWPGALQAVLILVLLYVALTHVAGVASLVGTVPAGLGHALATPPGGAGQQRARV